MDKTEITYTDDNGHLVVIMPGVVERLLSYRQISPVSLEAAGVLIGERRENHVVIHAISEPGPGDVRTRYTVVRKGSHHQALVNKLHYASGGTMNYLGEWHTHPERFPSPSAIDKSSWKQNIKSSEPVILLIIGKYGIWVGKKTNSILSKLETVTTKLSQ